MSLPLKELIKIGENQLREAGVMDSARDFEPCYISRYLLQLCSLFNKFYNNYRIIDNEKVSVCRLSIVECCKNKLERGLKLLGIEAPSAM